MSAHRESIPTDHVNGRELHVSVHARPGGDGSPENPFPAIQQAAAVAMPGDTITVHAGIYREEVSPPRGGRADEERIVYQAAPGEDAEIRGSEIVTGWERVEDEVWKTEIPNTRFGDFNPFAEEVTGHWFNPASPVTDAVKDGDWEEDKGKKGPRTHHASCVYIDGQWLFECGEKKELFKKNAGFGKFRMPMAYFAEVTEAATTVYARFDRRNPNEHLTEVNVRQTVFYPRQTGIDYITVRGFKLRHAACPWAPPTTEQIGLIGTNWSKGWIIEDNEITHAINVGITLGKYGDPDDACAKPTSKTYMDAIERAAAKGWCRETVGSHVVRNNQIAFCEQAGIVGSLGGVYSTISGNHIHHIHSQRRFQGAEMAGIKIHAAVDMTIANNRIHDAFMGVWLDWMAQGARISGNLLYRNDCHDLYIEVSHGPYLIDNNICLSGNSRHLSQGGAWAHNLYTGLIGNWSDPRATPWFKPHSTEIVQLSGITVGDDRFHNNLFVGAGKEESVVVENTNPVRSFYFSSGLRCYEYRPRLPDAAGNVYHYGAEACANETDKTICPEDMHVALIEEQQNVYLELTVSPDDIQAKTQMVDTDLLGMAEVTQQKFTRPDGTDLRIDTDYFGNPRDNQHPQAGPFETIRPGQQRIQVWPVIK